MSNLNLCAPLSRIHEDIVLEQLAFIADVRDRQHQLISRLVTLRVEIERLDRAQHGYLETGNRPVSKRLETLFDARATALAADFGGAKAAFEHNRELLARLVAELQVLDGAV